MKAYNTDVYDHGLDVVKQNCDLIITTDGVPSITDYAATLALKSAEVAVDAADFSITANGQARKVGHASQEGVVTATTNGSQDMHIAYLDTSGSRVLAITDETSNQPLTAGNPLTFPALDLRFTAPV